MHTATFKTAVKYNGQYHVANQAFSVENKDVAELEAIGAMVELKEIETKEETTNPMMATIYLETPISKLKMMIKDITDIAFLERLLEQDERSSAKAIYHNQIEELKTSK